MGMNEAMKVMDPDCVRVEHFDKETQKATHCGCY